MTANDMAKYLQFLAQSSDKKNATISRDILNQVFGKSSNALGKTWGQIVSPYANFSSGFDNYGLGWLLGHYRGETMLIEPRPH